MSIASTDRRYLDADSHILEPNGWLAPYADPAIRERLRPLQHPLAPDGDQTDDIVAGRGSGPLTDEKLWGKGYDAFGAWNAGERTALLDTFDIDAQLVFSTFAPAQFISKDPDLLYGGVRAHTRALADFCSADPRLLSVPLIPFADIERALAELDFALEQGCGAVLVPTTAPSKTMGPSHHGARPVLGPPAGCRRPVRDPRRYGRPARAHGGYRENGRPVAAPTSWAAARTSARRTSSTSATGPRTSCRCWRSTVCSSASRGLRGASIEQGAEWVPGMLKKLDGAMQFATTEPDLAALPMKAATTSAAR